MTRGSPRAGRLRGWDWVCRGCASTSTPRTICEVEAPTRAVSTGAPGLPCPRARDRGDLGAVRAPQRLLPLLLRVLEVAVRPKCPDLDVRPCRPEGCARRGRRGRGGPLGWSGRHASHYLRNMAGAKGRVGVPAQGDGLYDGVTIRYSACRHLGSIDSCACEMYRSSVPGKHFRL